MSVIDSIQLSGVTYTIQGSGGGGITSGEVQTMIDESISGKQDTMSAGTSINITDNVISLVADNALSKTSTNPVVNSAITDAVIVEGTQGSVDGHLGKKSTITKNFTYDENVYMFRTYKGGSYESYTENFQMILTNSSGGTQTYTNPEQTFSDDKVDFVVDSKYYFSATTKDDWYITKITFKETENPNGINWEYKWNRNGYPEMDAATAIHDYIYPELSGKTSSAQVQTMIDEAISGKQDTLSAGTGINITDNVISATGGGGGNPTVELTQAEYDALVTAGTVQADTYYIITDAQAGDLTNYYTKSETNTLLNGKQDTLVSGTNIKTINNTSILGSGNIDIQGGSGGKAIEAGEGISITTGETADTVSFNLPISAGTGDNALLIASDTYDISNKAKGNYSVSFNGGGIHPNYAYGTSSLAQGMDTKAYGTACHSEGYGSKAGVQNDINIQYAHAEGDHTQAKGTASHAEGSYTIANNWAEHASGRYNNSVSASTTFGDSGNTLFSVGNGTANNARHNAFEIRQNGDIYITSGGTDIKLQDNLGGGGGGGKAIEAGRGISITTGETADTVSFNLPISAGTGTNSIICGGHCIASKTNSAAFGNNASAKGQQSFAINQSTASGQDSFSQGTSYAENYLSAAFGRANYSKNQYELSCGSYNNSVSASTTFGDSGNTLFSVGNGTANNIRHNAFEIRQNGDIYLTLDGQDVKLQDQLGGSSITVDTALDSGSTNPVENRVIYNKIDEVEQVTAAGLNAVNDKFGGLKLQQLTAAEYNALATKDASTLYIIVN